jgi:hypothetical protein
MTTRPREPMETTNKNKDIYIYIKIHMMTTNPSHVKTPYMYEIASCILNWILGGLANSFDW